MLVKLKFLIFSVLFGSANVLADPFLFLDQDKATNIPSSFLRLYQYKTENENNNASAIAAREFFFSPEGRFNPQLEFKAAIKAFYDHRQIYGIQKTYAACAFPARQKILEKSLKIKFPEYPCDDMKQWVQQINADRVSIVFAGSYRGNPASIMGHTFIRLYHHSERDGNPLLSYAVGFMAHPDPADSSLVYMSKGLTGQYYGGYEIEPFYQKVGLYNNSESRDLWEYELNLKPEEVELLVLTLWEYTFNSKIPYYFIDENCSFRLIRLIDVVRPDKNLSNQLSIVVLPAETVRLLNENDLVRNSLKYRASLQTKLNYKINHLTYEQNDNYKKSLSNSMSLSKIRDPKILDAIIDYWNIQNYKKQTNLKVNEQQAMNAALLRRSEIHEISASIDDNQLRQYAQINPPFLGHKPSYLQIHIGETRQDVQFLSLDYAVGVHSADSPLFGYEQVTLLEYLKFKTRLSRKNHNVIQLQSQLTLLNALSLADLRDFEVSWGFESSYGNMCFDCRDSYSNIDLIALVGAALPLNTQENYIYFLPSIKNHIEFRTFDQSQYYPGLGYRLGYLHRLDKASLDSSFDRYYFQDQNSTHIHIGINYFVNLNYQFKLQYSQNMLSDSNQKFKNELSSIGIKLYF